jgi:CheY-like chemotaxis protein
MEGSPLFSRLPAESTSRSPADIAADCTILLIEDNPADANLVQEALLEHGVHCNLIHIKDGEEGVRFVNRLDRGEAPCPDLVILDLNLPRQPGSAVLERMRASSSCAHVPVVVLTSSNNQKDRDQAAKLGASLYIRKPSQLTELLKLGALFKQILEEASRRGGK